MYQLHGALANNVPCHNYTPRPGDRFVIHMTVFISIHEIAYMITWPMYELVRLHKIDQVIPTKHMAAHSSHFSSDRMNSNCYAEPSRDQARSENVVDLYKPPFCAVVCLECIRLGIPILGDSYSPTHTTALDASIRPQDT